MSTTPIDSAKPTDQEIDQLLTLLRRFIRPVFVSGLYLVPLLYFGVSVWKALVAVAVILPMQLLNIGTQRISQLGAALLVVAGILWVEIEPLNRWMQLAAAKIEVALH